MILWMRNTEQNDYVASQSLCSITKKGGVQDSFQPSVEDILSADPQLAANLCNIHYLLLWWSLYTDDDFYQFEFV